MPADTIFRIIPGTAQSLSSTTTSSAIANGFGAGCTVVRVMATAAVNIRIDSGSPVAVTTDTLIAANYPEYFNVTANQKLAAIGTGTVSVTECA